MTSIPSLKAIGLASAALVGLVGCGSPATTTTPSVATPSSAAAASATTATPPVTTPSSAAAASATTTTPSENGPDFTSVGFSTGGSKCSLGDAASSFAVGLPIHTVLTMSPALPAGGTVKVTIEKDGTELVEARQTITVTEPAPCVWGTLPSLEAGHYRMSYAISPSAMPPVSGEFDVTP